MPRKLAGKRIALFATSGSSGISTSVSEARSLWPRCHTYGTHIIVDIFNTVTNDNRVPAWLEEIGANREEQDKPDAPDATSLKMNITVGDRTLTATMEDNAAGEGFPLPAFRLRLRRERLQRHD